MIAPVQTKQRKQNYVSTSTYPSVFNMKLFVSIQSHSITFDHIPPKTVVSDERGLPASSECSESEGESKRRVDVRSCGGGGERGGGSMCVTALGGVERGRTTVV